MATHLTREIFDRTAATYDVARVRLIPCFHELYGTAVALLPETADHVLDLGAGTGLLSAFIRERFPKAYLHLIDNSKPMLDQARERFRRDQETTFQLGDYSEVVEARQYDAVVSALSIHHLPDEAKQRLFLEIYRALKPGGLFVNAEQILAPTPEREAQAKADWLAEVRALGATEEQIEASLLRQTEDRCATVGSQLEWMSVAGLQDVRCVFEQGRFAVLCGARAGNEKNIEGRRALVHHFCPAPSALLLAGCLVVLLRVRGLLVWVLPRALSVAVLA